MRRVKFKNIKIGNWYQLRIRDTPIGKAVEVDRYGWMSLQTPTGRVYKGRANDLFSDTEDIKNYLLRIADDELKKN